MFIIVLIFGIANALNLYIPLDLSKKIDLNVTIKKYKDVKNIDFNNSLAIIKVDDIKTIFDKNLTVIYSFDKTKRVIITHKKLLKNINTIANLGLPEKILLEHLNSHYKVVKGDLKAFLEKKFDAIVIDETTLKKLNENNFFVFKLEDFGIVLSKYFLVYDKKFFDYKNDQISEVYSYFNKKFGSLNSSLLFKTIIFSNLYYNDNIKFYNLFWKKFIGDREKRKKTILKVGINVWEPFTIVNKEIEGIGIDFWKLVANKINLKYKFIRYYSWLDLLKALKNKEVDVIVNTSETEDRKKYAVFSKPYISFPLGIVCRNDETFNSIEEITSIAVGKEFTAQKMMKKHYPNLNYVEVSNVTQALKVAQNKKVDCAVDILPVILWYINKKHFFNLQLAFETEFKFDVQFMLNPNYIFLLPDINNAIDSIPEEKKRSIVNKYMKSIVYKKNEENNIILISLLLLMTIFLVLIFVKYLKAQKFSKIDPLTSIYNRRGVLLKLKGKKEGAILFMDLDHFKKVNDTYGHEFGDYVLQEVGKILRSYIRDEDIVGRWGGEEFIMILSKVSFDDAMNVAERLRKTIENYDFKGKKITTSIGVSELTDNFEESLEKADKALYEAKKGGRNLVKGKK